MPNNVPNAQQVRDQVRARTVEAIRRANTCRGRWKRQPLRKKLSLVAVVSLGLIWGIAAVTLWVRATEVVACFRDQTKETLCMDPVSKSPVIKPCIFLGGNINKDFLLKEVASSIDTSERLTIYATTRGIVNASTNLEWTILAQLTWNDCCRPSLMIANPMLSPYAAMSQESEGDFMIFANAKFETNVASGGVIRYDKPGPDGDLGFDTQDPPTVTFDGSTLKIVTAPIVGLSKRTQAKLQLLGSMINSKDNCIAGVPGTRTHYQTCIPEMQNCYMDTFVSLVAAVGLVAMLPLIMCFIFLCKGCWDFFCMSSDDSRPYELVADAGVSTSARVGAQRRGRVDDHVPLRQEEADFVVEESDEDVV